MLFPNGRPLTIVSKVPQVTFSFTSKFTSLLFDHASRDVIIYGFESVFFSVTVPLTFPCPICLRLVGDIVGF